MSNTDLKDFIKIYNNTINPTFAESIVNRVNKEDWKEHLWYSSATNTAQNSSKGKDCYINNLNPKSKIQLLQTIKSNVDDYKKTFGFSSTTISDPRINRYEVGQNMDYHYDHIHSLFDGQNKGIPIFSIVIILNNDFNGGKLRFWKNYAPDLASGDMIIWPSNFLYKHEVTPVERGIRYSVVIWGW